MIIDKSIAGFFLREYDPQYCLDSFHLVNDSGAEADIDLAGQPCKASGANMTPVLATDEASATHWCVNTGKVNLADSAVSQVKHAFLARGPAVCSEAGIPTVDIAGTDFTVATLKTALEGLDVVVRDNTGNLTETQTT